MGELCYHVTNVSPWPHRCWYVMVCLNMQQAMIWSSYSSPKGTVPCGIGSSGDVAARSLSHDICRFFVSRNGEMKRNPSFVYTTVTV